MIDPLAPLPSDRAMLDAMMANETGLRNTVLLLRALASGTDLKRPATVMTEAADGLRVLFNAVKENQSCRR